MTEPAAGMEERVRTALREAALGLPEATAPAMRHPVSPRGSAPRLLIAAGTAVAVIAIAVAAVVVTGSGHTSKPGAGAPVMVAASRLPTLEADVLVFMRVDATQAQIDAVNSQVRRSRAISAFTFLDKQAALAEFRQIYRNNPDLTRNVTADALPESFRLLVPNCGAQQSLIDQLSRQSGADRIQPGAGLPHDIAARLAYRQSLPPDRIDGHCGYHQPKGPAVATLTITALPTLTFDSQHYTVRSGIVEITLATGGGIHQLAFDDSKYRGFVLTAPSGPTRGKVQLKPGTYTIYDPILGHRQAGEQATIKVT